MDGIGAVAGAGAKAGAGPGPEGGLTAMGGDGKK